MMGEVLGVYRYESGFEDANLDVISSMFNRLNAKHAGKVYANSVDSYGVGYDYKAIVFTPEEVSEEEGIRLFKAYIDVIYDTDDDED